MSIKISKKFNKRRPFEMENLTLLNLITKICHTNGLSFEI